MGEDKNEVVGMILPKQYGPWTLKTHEVTFNESGDPSQGVIQYEGIVSETEKYSMYIELENDGSWGGGLLDVGEPENPHRDAIETFYAERVEDVLEQARAYMDEELSVWSRNE